MGKLLIAFCALSMSSTAWSSAKLLTPVEKATSMAEAITKTDYQHLSSQLDVHVIQATEKADVVKVELGIGTKGKPARMNNCVTVTFDETGFVKQIQQELDADSCE